jgi:hypothetical protein
MMKLDEQAGIKHKPISHFIPNLDFIPELWVM